MKAKGVRLHAANDLRLEEFELPEITDDEILVKVVSDSICMSTYKCAILGVNHKRVHEDVADHPAIMGHEIGHVIAGHHAEGKSNETAAGIVMIGKQVADIVTGGATSVISNDLVGQGLSLGLLKFNRTQEYEADKYSYRVMKYEF